jgi:hypothetical protein
MIVPSERRIVYESSDWFEEQTAHGLLVLAHDQATQAGFFSALRTHITLKQKTYDYTVYDKLSTLWASILVGCHHTVEINTKLGPQEQALAALFGLERFPDQSGVNTTLRLSTPETVAQMRALNLDLLVRNSRARVRRLQTKLRRGRVLFVDIDQRGLCVSGKAYELAAEGWFSRKRSPRGYQLSLAFIGGQIGEVLDEYLDPGSTPAGARIEALLGTLATWCERCRIPRQKVVIRADAQYGTPAIIEKITAAGFGFLIKDISPQRARRLAREVPESMFADVTPRANAEVRQAADLGQQRLEGKPADRREPGVVIEARVIVVRWQQEARASGSRPGKTTRARQAQQRQASAPARQMCYSALLTNLTPEQVSVAEALDHYDDRATIERYFRDEQCAFGARSVRTHKAAGAAVFQWMVAITNNLLRWMRARCFAGTRLETYGASRLIEQAFQIPARLLRTGATLRVIFPERHLLVAALLHALAAPAAQPIATSPPGLTGP